MVKPIAFFLFSVTLATSAVAQQGRALTSSSVGMKPPAAASFTPPGVVLSVDGSFDLGGLLFLDGQRFLHNDGDPLRTNTALGIRALNSVTNSAEHTAIGNKSLYSLTGGGNNTAIGSYAMYNATQAFSNVAVGGTSLYNNDQGQGNVAIGSYALGMNQDGGYNIGIGFGAGENVVNTSRNIFIANGGTLADANTLRIGESLSRAFVDGIRGVTTDEMDAIPVLIDSKGQLGTIDSSARYKEEIYDIEGASAAIHDLRPVTFRYRQASANGNKPRQFGLLAEEVAEVFPELAVLDESGQPETVKYHLLSTLLLNEVQKQERRIRTQGWILTLLFATTLALAIGRWRQS